jgi:hypothetical protein
MGIAMPIPTHFNIFFILEQYHVQCCKYINKKGITTIFLGVFLGKMEKR